jgi:ABC-type multidrug transport system fused ATPase/permease subunit
MELIKNSWQALEGSRRYALFLVGLLGISGLLEGLVLITLIPVFNSGSSTEPLNSKWYSLLEFFGINPDNLLYVSLTAFACIGLLSSVLLLLAETSIFKFRTKLEASFRVKISKALLKMDWSNFHSMRLGDINKAILMEPGMAAQGIWHFLTAFGALLIAIFFSITALFISTKMTLITFAFVSFVGLGYKFVNKKAFKHAELWSSSATTIGERVSEIFGNLKFLRSTGRSVPAKEKAIDIYKHHAVKFYWSQAFNIYMRFIYQSGGILFLGGLLAFSLLSYRLPIGELIVLLAVFYRLVPRIRAVMENLYQARTYQTWYLTWKERYDLVNSHQEHNTGTLQPSFEKSIQFQNLSFSYPNSERPVLQEVDFAVEKNQCVALVGESGSGKSTLIDLLTGLLSPTQGQVLLDEIPLNKLAIDSWRLKIGLVIQESPIFHTTILENIAWGYENPNPESAKRCAQLAHAWEFIQTLPEGLNTVVGEKGGRISVGQKQRIALARALYRDPSLLILDEATSALDGESEKYIQESLKSIKGQFAIFMVAHRLKTVQMADKIIVIGEGKILEQGTWSELINKPSGTFRRMAQLQGLVKPSEKLEIG